MEATVVDFSDNEVDIKVKEEDVSILYLLQHELLQNKKVDFAGVALRHPVTKEYEMRVVTDAGNPLDVIVEAAKDAQEYVEELSGMLKKIAK